MTDNDTDAPPDSAPAGDALPPVVIALLKGVIYQEADAHLWNALHTLQARVRDYVRVLGLQLVLDEAEGYAFLRSPPQVDDPADDTPASTVPRLIARRPLGFQQSLLLALLRKKLAEFDASGGDTRLVLTLDDMVQMQRLFMPAGSNEAGLSDKIENLVRKTVELGFLRQLKATADGAGGAPSYEVCRILKAFVDAQWLGEFETRLEGYRLKLQADTGLDDDA